MSKESKPNIKNQSRSFNKIGSFEIQNRVEMSEEDKMSEINEANEKENTGSSFTSILRLSTCCCLVRFAWSVQFRDFIGPKSRFCSVLFCLLPEGRLPGSAVATSVARR